MSLVLDASVALAITLDEDAPIDLSLVREYLATGRVFVPSIWHLEVSNVVLSAIRRDQIDLLTGLHRLHLLDGFHVESDNTDDLVDWSDLIRLAIRHNLTTYDASYLELALRHGANLLTLDKALARAARAEGIEVIGVAPD
jgi:predicted nucleic acid-binding protein